MLSIFLDAEALQAGVARGAGNAGASDRFRAGDAAVRALDGVPASD
ncbi:MAG: hypothetical protein KGJ99_03610 [Betaproteobacteria bacterium]|nr:hypothetical protein [Betaproteobacteria bacterium]MDE2003418.1 hypothetical protein [Betaproteobacteria bacterium]MDE2208794.1 hypothetical protein [Betaproteobacteria bacterium]